MLTFVLIGFWHGASWNFVIFGVYHAVWVAIYGYAVRNRPAWTSRIPFGSQIAIVFHLLAVGLVGSLFFREQNAGRILEHLSRNPFAGTMDDWVATVVVLSVTLAGCVPLFLGWLFDRYAKPKVEGSPWLLPLQTTAWAAYLAAMTVFYRLTAQDFVYFQF